MKKLLAVLLLLALSTVSSAGVFIYGWSLLSFLEEGTENSVSIATGYVLGVSDTLSALNLICVPDNIDNGQLTVMAKNHLKNNPSIRHKGSADEIGALYIRTFPCNDSPK